MKNIIKLSLGIFLLLVFLIPQDALAATIRSNETVLLSKDEKNLSDLYLFGEMIRVETPVTNDIVAAGGKVYINGEITGSVIAAGGNIEILGKVDNTIRVAGGDILIDGAVGRDVVVAGGNVQITKNASISGDLLFFGGKLSILAPVEGRVIINGGDILIDSIIGGNVEGDIENLTLGKNAVINGDLRYESGEKASISDTAVIKGENVFKKIDRPEDTGRTVGELVKAGTYYKLFADILFSLLFVLIAPLFLRSTILSIKKSPLGNTGVGIVALFLIPVVSIFLLLIIWLGIFAFVAYLLLLILSMVIANIFAGNLILSWVQKQSNKEYVLDWKAAVVGPVALYILWLIPIFGWLIAFVIYLMAFAGLLHQIYMFSLSQRVEKKE